MWTEKNNELHGQFKFQDFGTAMAFIFEVSLLAERMDHHPTWTNTWNKVDIVLSTHDAGNTITEKDHKLAKGIDKIVKKYLQ